MSKLEEQIDRALKVLGSYTKPRVHIVRPAKPRGGKLRAPRGVRVAADGGVHYKGRLLGHAVRYSDGRYEAHTPFAPMSGILHKRRQDAVLEVLKQAGVSGAHGGKARLAPAGRVGPRGGHTDVQALLFPLAAGWTPAKAKAWAKTNGFHYGKVHVKGNHIRLRQRDPGEYRRLRTMCLDDACHVKAIIGVR